MMNGTTLQPFPAQSSRHLLSPPESHPPLPRPPLRVSCAGVVPTATGGEAFGWGNEEVPLLPTATSPSPGYTRGHRHAEQAKPPTVRPIPYSALGSYTPTLHLPASQKPSPRPPLQVLLHPLLILSSSLSPTYGRKRLNLC
jgi:hypothetical protein